MRALSKAERAGLRVALYAAAACVIAFLQQSRSVLGQPASAQGSTTVDVAVMDGSGAPAAGLSSGDFRVTVDGRSREVLSTEFLTTSSPGAAAQDRSTDRGNDAATSVATAGRSIYMVLDRSSIFAGNERALTNAAAAIIDRLAPADRAALITFPEPGPRVGLTAAATEVEEALGRVKGSRSPELANFATGIGEALSIAEGDTFALTSVADRECRDVPALRTRIDQGVRTSAPDARTECVRRITRNVETMVLQAEQASRPVYEGVLALLSALRDVSGPKTVVIVTGGLAIRRFDGAFDEVGARASTARASLWALICIVVSTRSARWGQATRCSYRPGATIPSSHSCGQPPAGIR